ncbi:MAG: glucosyltransferase domain-containing protein [Akkermansia sp.]|nr:glucosyltransferase domain-containing protein [Akkermansia sp.]
MNCKQTVSTLMQRVQASPGRNVWVWCIYILIFLLIYGAMLVRGGYHWDETLDFSGGALDTYVANGRWGLVLWRCVFGMGCAVWTSGLLAGVLLTVSLVLQTRLLKLETPGLQLLYGLLYMVQIQFAYQMDYFFLCDATAFGLLAVTWAVMLVERGGLRRLLLAAAAVTFAVAVYQCLVLNFFVLMLLLMLKRLILGESLRVVRKGLVTVGVSFAAVVGWYLIKLPVQLFVPVDADALAFCQEYAERLNYREQLFSAEWYLYVGRMLRIMAEHAMVPLSYDGELFYASATVPLILLAVYTVRKVQGRSRQVLALSLLVLLWLSPFAMYMVIGETWPCYPHTKLAQPLVMAAFWVIAIPLIKWSVVWRYVGGAVLVVCVVQASALVSRHAGKMQASFEERLLRLHHTETDGVRVAVQNGIPLRKGCILYYPASHNWEKNGYVDFSGDYPALLYMEGATSARLYRSRHREHLLQMPVWPAEGAIRVVDDTVIIKGPEI